MTDQTHSTDETDTTDAAPGSGLGALLSRLLGGGGPSITAVAVPADNMDSSRVELEIGNRMLARRVRLYQSVEVLFLPLLFEEVDADDLAMLGAAALHEKPMVLLCLDSEVDRIPASMRGYVHVLTRPTRDELFGVEILDEAEAKVAELARAAGVSKEDIADRWGSAFDAMRATSRMHAEHRRTHHAES